MALCTDCVFDGSQIVISTHVSTTVFTTDSVTEMRASFCVQFEIQELLLYRISYKVNYCLKKVVFFVFVFFGHLVLLYLELQSANIFPDCIENQQ